MTFQRIKFCEHLRLAESLGFLGLLLTVLSAPSWSQTRLDLAKQGRNLNIRHYPDVRFSGNKATVCSDCATEVATARLLNSTRQYSGPVEMTLNGGSSQATTVRFYIDSALNLRAQYDATVITSAAFGASLLPDTLGTQFPAVSLPLYSCAVSNLAFTACADLRASGSWIPSSSNGTCSLTPGVNGWDFNCQGPAVTLTRDLQAASCEWNGAARPKDISVKAASDPGSVCFNGIGALTFPNASTGVEMLFSTIVPERGLANIDVQVDVFSDTTGSVSMTLAVACRAANSAQSNYQDFPVTYTQAEPLALTLSTGQTQRFLWFNKVIPDCNAGQVMHWQLIRDAADGHAAAVQVVRAAVVQRLN